MKHVLLLALLLPFSAQAQTTYLPRNGMANWCWNGAAWYACAGSSTPNPTDKFPVNGRGTWCWNGTNWIACP